MFSKMTSQGIQKQERDTAENEGSEMIHRQVNGTSSDEGNIPMEGMRCEVTDDNDNMESHNSQILPNFECTILYDEITIKTENDPLMMGGEGDNSYFPEIFDNVVDKTTPSTSSDRRNQDSSDEDVPLRTLRSRKGVKPSEDIKSSPGLKKRRSITSGHQNEECYWLNYVRGDSEPKAGPSGHNTQRARAPAKNQQGRSDEEIDLLQYGSEDEEDQEADDNEPVVPRTLRMFFEPDTDTAEEAEAAGCVDVAPQDLSDDAEGKPHGPTSLFAFEWRSYPTNPIPPQQRREKFVGKSGPAMKPTTDPYEIFTKFWDRSIMKHIVDKTNLYAQEYAAYLLDSGLMAPHSRIVSWEDTNVDELYVYFAIVLAMGIVVKSKMEEYWGKERNIFQTPHFSTHMHLKRFQLLSRCIHFNDNSRLTKDTPPKEAKIFKVAPVVDHLNSKFSSLYNLHRNVALDESLTLWKGWLNMKQYIPNKKSVVGIKTYEVCDSLTGYLWRFEVHAGAKNHPKNEGIINGGIPNLVLRLLKGLEHSGRTIWMDNYYNSPSLARVLKTLGLDCVGTLRTTREFVPNEISDLKKGDMTVGQVCGCTSGDVDLVVWRDQNQVAMISTYHGVAVSYGKPTVVKDYNVCMGGVDRKDQLLSMYPIERKRTQIWYKKFFRRLLNVSVLNAYIIAKSFNPKLEHRDFRQDLILELLKRHNPNPQPILGLSEQLKSKLLPEVMAHFPKKLPYTPGKINNRLRRTCHVCKKRTIYICKACDKSLCFDSGVDCYEKFHS